MIKNRIYCVRKERLVVVLLPVIAIEYCLLSSGSSQCFQSGKSLVKLASHMVKRNKIKRPKPKTKSCHSTDSFVVDGPWSVRELAVYRTRSEAGRAGHVEYELGVESRALPGGWQQRGEWQWRGPMHCYCLTFMFLVVCFIVVVRICFHLCMWLYEHGWLPTESALCSLDLELQADVSHLMWV